MGLSSCLCLGLERNVHFNTSQSSVHGVAKGDATLLICLMVLTLNVSYHWIYSSFIVCLEAEVDCVSGEASQAPLCVGTATQRLRILKCTIDVLNNGTVSRFIHLSCKFSGEFRGKPYGRTPTVVPLDEDFLSLAIHCFAPQHLKCWKYFTPTRQTHPCLLYTSPSPRD